MHSLGMRRNVFTESFQKECVDDFGFLVWHLLISKTLIELQGVARGAVLTEGRRLYVTRLGTRLAFFARAHDRNSRIRREEHGFSRGARV